MSRRPPDFNLNKAIADAGFTPGQRDVPALLDLFLGGPPVVRDRAERALRRAGSVVIGPAMERARLLRTARGAPSSYGAPGVGATSPGGGPAPRSASPEPSSGAAEGAPGAVRSGDVTRGRLVTLVVRIAGAEASPEVRAFLLEGLGDADAGVRRRSAAGLGRGRERDDEALAALAKAAADEGDAAARAAMIEALGKRGGDAANEALAAIESAPAKKDAKTEAALRKARVRVARPKAREEGSRIDTARDVARPIAGAAGAGAGELRGPTGRGEAATDERRPVRVWLDCRRGMLPVLLEEARAMEPRVEHRLDGSMVAALDLRAPLATLFAARTWTGIALPGGVEKIVNGDLVRAASLAIAYGPAREAVGALTTGPLRYRLAWGSGGKRRASVFAIAEAVTALDPALVNDPTDAVWEVVVRESANRVAVEWAPSLEDPRFAYRKGDVPAASHPTIAAALAYLAGVTPDDVVWDPFVGSGLELCERSLRGPYARLVGTDIDPSALDVARENLKACGAQRFELAEHDAGVGAPRGVRPTLVITNPPLGRRMHRSADLRGMLVRFVGAVARSLAPRGRFVWVSPFAADMRAAAEAGGLAIRRAHVIDLGGFDAEIQVWTKPK